VPRALAGTAGVALVACLLILSPSAFASGKVVLTAPYANARGFPQVSYSTEGCATVSIPVFPYWNATTGRGGASAGTTATSCPTYGATPSNESTANGPTVAASVQMPLTFTTGTHTVFANWTFQGAGHLTVKWGTCAPTTSASRCSVALSWEVTATAYVYDATTGNESYGGTYLQTASESNSTTCSLGACHSTLSSSRHGHWGAVSFFTANSPFNATHRYVLLTGFTIIVRATTEFSGTTLTGASATASVSMSSSTRYADLVSVTIT
jgi:hypothetical protein